MIDKSELQTALQAMLPPHLHADISRIADLLISLANQSLPVSAVNTDQATLLKALTAILEGGSVQTRDAVVSFGKDLQAGSVSIRDVAGGNIINLNLNVLTPVKPPYKSHQETYPSLRNTEAPSDSASELAFLDNYPHGGLVLESRTWRKFELDPKKKSIIAIINDRVLGSNADLIKPNIPKVEAQALKNINQHQIPLVLQSHNICVAIFREQPDDTGMFATLALLKTIAQVDSRIIRIVTISRYKPHTKYIQMRELGADAILLEPFDLSELVSIIEHSLSYK